MNCPWCNRGILKQWVNSWLRWESHRIKQFLVWCERISWSWNCGQLWSVPRYQSTLNKSELQNCASPRFWIAAWNTQYDGYLRRFWTTTCSRRTTSKYLETSRNLASSSRGVKPKLTEHTMTTGSKRRPEQQDLSNSRNILHCGDGISRHTGGTYSHVGMMEYPRFPISELHLAKFPDSMEFESWKVNFKTEVCAKTANPQITMSWITEVEKAKSIDESSTSQSILGRTDFPDCEMLDVMIASALKKILNSHIQFLKRICVEEQRAQKYDRFLRGRQISYMICEHFHAPRAYESVQGLSDLFTIRLQNDDVQDFRCQMVSGTIISRWTTFG